MADKGDLVEVIGAGDAPCGPIHGSYEVSASRFASYATLQELYKLNETGGGGGGGGAATDSAATIDGDGAVGAEARTSFAVP